MSELRTQKMIYLNPIITFNMSLNKCKYIKLITSFGLQKHMLRQDIVAGTYATLACFKQN